MASNKLYGLPTRIELKTMRDPTTKQKAETFGDHGQAIYMNTTVLENGKIASVEDKDHDYEILHHKFSPPNSNLPAEKSLKHGLGAIGKEYRCVFIVFGGMMCALFFMVTGVAVALGFLHKTGELQHSWEPWAQWSPCSASCDFGMSLRKRNCSKGDSNAGFTDCVGDASEYQLCKELTCNETYRIWSAWVQWSFCSASCDVGMRHRRRDCNEISSRENAVYCNGDATEYQLCNEGACSVINGGWNDWLGWETCSATCGTGLQTRHRNCSNPTPRNGGEHCFGESADYRLCKLRTCPAVNGSWNAWATWGSCSATCGTGLQSRQRECSNPRPGNGGEPCSGESTDYRSCHLKYCSDTVYIPKVAFNAREAANLTLQTNQVIVFKTIIMNYGGAYNSNDGTFYAPVDGFYQFNGHLCVVQGGKNLDYTIMIDSTAIVSGEYRAPSDAIDGKCIGFGAAAIVRKWQRVTISFKDGSVYSGNILFQNDNDWNSFSGILINTI